MAMPGNNWNSTQTLTISTDSYTTTAATAGNYVIYDPESTIYFNPPAAQPAEVPESMLTPEGWLDKQLARYRVAL